MHHATWTRLSIPVFCIIIITVYTYTTVTHTLHFHPQKPVTIGRPRGCFHHQTLRSVTMVQYLYRLCDNLEQVCLLDCLSWPDSHSVPTLNMDNIDYINV